MKMYLVFLFNFNRFSLNDNSLKKYCLKLENFLKHNVYSNVDGLDLFKEVLQIGTNILIEHWTIYIKKLYSFSNAHITFIILLLKPTIVASVERNC